MKSYLIALCVSSGLLLGGCATDEQKLIGKWKDTEQVYWTFNADHTLVLSEAKRSSMFSKGALAAKMANVRADEFRLTWSLNAKPDPNLLAITLHYQGESGTADLIQEFSSSTAMRIGMPPPSFQNADWIMDMVKQ